MATATLTTRSGATEGLPLQDSLTPSIISATFSHLLDALARHVAAERDLEDVDFWDTAFLAWRVEAEDSYTEVATLLSAILREPLHRQGDEALQGMASLIDHMIGSEEPGTFQRLHCSLPRFDAFFMCTGDGVATADASRMLRSARGLIDELASLQLYAETNGDEIGGPAPESCAELAA